MNLVLRKLTEDYEQQLQYYGKMFELAVRQGRCVHAEEVDTDLLMDLIGQRQELIEVLEQSSAGIARLKEEIRQALDIEEFTLTRLKGRVEETGLENLGLLLEELSALLQKIKELDKTNEETLRRRIQETSEDLKRMGKAKKARKAYQQKLVNKDGVFIDFSK